MAQSDAELYLRLTGERALLDRFSDGDPSENAALDAAAHALVAVGAMMAGAAQAIVDDYDLASAYRTGQRQRHHRALQRAARKAATSRRAQPALRAVPCHRLIEQPWGQLILRYVVLSDEVTDLHVTMRPVPPPEGRSRSAAYRGRLAGGGPRPWGAGSYRTGLGLPGQVTVADDRGTTSTASFSGGGGITEWHGEYQARPPLAPDTAWIDVYGERIELPGPSSGRAEVRVEPCPDGDPAHGYLRARLASLAESHSSGAMETAIEALVAAGTLPPGDPAIAEVRAVADVLFAGHGPAPGSTTALPEPWRSMLPRRGQGGGPQGEVAVGATTPPFDGITLAILAVRSADESFTADVEVIPALMYSHWAGDSVGTPLVAWRAEDDRGHHYLGQQAEWHSAPDRSGGQIQFWPALDPAARVLDITPTTMAARAVIRVPLEWGEEL
ncbi:MAG: hypothetical protein ACRDND_00575 [Streptosporangiaceae bacterium]